MQANSYYIPEVEVKLSTVFKRAAELRDRSRREPYFYSAIADVTGWNNDWHDAVDFIDTYYDPLDVVDQPIGTKTLVFLMLAAIAESDGN